MFIAPAQETECISFFVTEMGEPQFFMAIYCLHGLSEDLYYSSASVIYLAALCILLLPLQWQPDSYWFVLPCCVAVYPCMLLLPLPHSVTLLLCWPWLIHGDLLPSPSNLALAAQKLFIF